jgi:hypothetical protein
VVDENDAREGGGVTGKIQGTRPIPARPIAIRVYCAGKRLMRKRTARSVRFQS